MPRKSITPAIPPSMMARIAICNNGTLLETRWPACRRRRLIEGTTSALILGLRGSDKKDQPPSAEHFTPTETSRVHDSIRAKCPLARTHRPWQLALHRLCHESGKLPHVLLRRVERAHPAHHRRLFAPHVKEIPLSHPGNGRTWNPGKHTVCLHPVTDFHLRDLSEQLLQQLRHAVGMLRVLEPQPVREQGLELGRNEAHLGSQLHALLAQIEKIPAERPVKEDHRLSTYRPIFGTTKGEHVAAQVPSGLPQGLPQAGGGVR